MTVGEPGDPATNPTVLWPSDRKEFKAGTLTFTSATLQDGAECKNINYDPLVMSDDISLRPTIPRSVPRAKWRSTSKNQSRPGSVGYCCG